MIEQEWITGDELAELSNIGMNTGLFFRKRSSYKMVHFNLGDEDKEIECFEIWYN